MINNTSEIKQYIDEHIRVAKSIYGLHKDISKVSKIIIDAYHNDKKVLLCGNGGSAADAQHIAAEFVGRFLKERRALSAIALNVNCSSVTALANDYGYEKIFARQLEAHGQKGDVLITISTSGNSENILNAAYKAKEMGILVLGLTGRGGGKLKAITDYCLCIPSDNTPRIQEMHILIGHIISGLVEDALC
jgi:D-sedoheptulose 7-phosphate isomerase